MSIQRFFYLKDKQSLKREGNKLYNDVVFIFMEL